MIKNDLAPLLHELVARKEQVLNLETRLFVSLLVFEVAFVVLFFARSNRDSLSKQIALCSTLLIIAVLLIGINAKMGLVSKYLVQLEEYLTQEGAIGLVWERKVVSQWIFAPGNAFTLASAFCGLLIVAQLASALFIVGRDWLGNAMVSGLLTLLICAGILAVSIKSLTVDFGAAVPKFF